jgi:uncharacterized iron-regulated membrane protein
MAGIVRRKLTWRSILQQIHLWLGVLLCLPLLALGISGSILVFHHEIEDLFRDRAGVSAVGMPHSAPEILAAAQATAPDRTPLMLRMPDAAGEPAAVRLSRPLGERGPAGGSPFAGTRQVLIDPVSLATVDSANAAAPVMRFLHDLHGNLLIGGRDGRVVVGWFGVVMVFMCLSGVVLWWPRGRWGAAFTIRRGARGFRLHRDLHGALGIWSLAVLFIVSFSGAYLAFPQEIGAAITSVFPGRDLRAAAAALRVQPVRNAAPIDLEKAVAVAQDAAGPSSLRAAFLPARPDQPMRLALAREGHGEGAPMVTVFVDPWSGKVVEIHDPRAFTTGETILAWQRAIHEGSGLGPVYKLLVFLSGIAIPVFAVTGVMMWLIKRRASKRSDAGRMFPRGAGTGPAADLESS